MLRFHVSYDVKNSKVTDNKDVLKGLVETLIKKLGAIEIQRPVASTLTFEADVTRGRVWEVLEAWSTIWGTWYFASEIVESEDGKHWRCITKADSELQNDVDALIHELKS